MEVEEYGEIERHQEFLKKHYPEFLAKTRKIRLGRRTEIVVSDFAKKALTYAWNNPGDEKPDWFRNSQKRKKKKSGRLRDYIRDYFEFPTSGKAAATIKDKELRYFLFRWHKDYSSICEYTHVAFGKILIPFMSEFKGVQITEKTEFNGKRLAEKTIYFSHIAAATSCALIASSLRDDYGSTHQVRRHWKTLCEGSLPANVYWNMYI